MPIRVISLRIHWRVVLTRVSPQASANTLSISWCSVWILLPPPTQESFLFVISCDSRGNDGESEKAFCQLQSVWQSEWSLACEKTRRRPRFFSTYIPADGKMGRAKEKEGEREMTEGARKLCGTVAIGGKVREGTEYHTVTPRYVSTVPWWSQPQENAGCKVMKHAGCQFDRSVISWEDQSQTWQLLGLSATVLFFLYLFPDFINNDVKKEANSRT